MIKNTLIFSLGFILSLVGYNYYYNPVTIMNESLRLATTSYYYGCLEAKGSGCKVKALSYQDSISRLLK